MVFDTFRQDEKTIRAVEMDFIIIGECAAQIPEELKKEHPHIPWDLMRAMRNRLVHAYFGVDEQLMWDTIHNELPPLVPALKKLLE